MYLFDLHTFADSGSTGPVLVHWPQLSSKKGARQQTLVVPWLDSGLDSEPDKFAKMVRVITIAAGAISNRANKTSS
jgi:hypothetical protein